MNLWEGMSLKNDGPAPERQGRLPLRGLFEGREHPKPDFPLNDEIPNGVLYRYEGYLFPDTYEFYPTRDAETVVKKMMDNFEKKMTDDLVPHQSLGP